MSREQDQNSVVRINRGNLGSISVYEVTEDELAIMEQGSPNSTYLNFAIGLASVGVSFFISIFSTEITDNRVFIVFWIVALVTVLVGIVLFSVWYKASKGTGNVIQRIRNRMNPAQLREVSESEVENEEAQQSS